MEILETVRKQFENIQKFRKFDKLKRVVQKDGTTSVLYKNISKKRRRYFYDFYTTLLDSSWSYCVLMFASSFYGSWLFFAILYYAISYIHGDLDQENNQNSEWIPCINQIGIVSRKNALNWFKKLNKAIFSGSKIELFHVAPFNAELIYPSFWFVFNVLHKGEQYTTQYHIIKLPSPNTVAKNTYFQDDIN